MTISILLDISADDEATYRKAADGLGMPLAQYLLTHQTALCWASCLDGTCAAAASDAPDAGAPPDDNYIAPLLDALRTLFDDRAIDQHALDRQRVWAQSVWSAMENEGFPAQDGSLPRLITLADQVLGAYDERFGLERATPEKSE